ncbi:MAG: hypothetical protein QOH25_3609 [Acidobacteriota bacterium]|jgi:hypothetical protein|nr:hypothetical protein [Acidobacteriota bacterium]
MSLSSFLIRIILLVIPGIVCSLLYRTLRGRVSRKDWEDYLEILAFSFICYSVYGFFAYALSLLRPTDDAFAALRAFTNENVPIDKAVGHAIIWASLIALPVAFVASYIDSNKIINKLGRKLKATARFGDEDVWDFLHHSPAIKGGWVTVRDHKLKLNYLCWIQAFSDSGKERELLLRDVDVYNDVTGECLYKTDLMYISRKQDELTIEATIASNEAQSEVLELDGDERLRLNSQEPDKEVKNEG